jgi:radical SAM superfamily enzyme YgiQ (UPF0313 family)
MEKWDVEIIDENNLGEFGPRSETGTADHESLQEQRPADVVGLYGGLTSTIPRLHEIAKFYKNLGVTTIAGGQHFAEETIPESLSKGIDYIASGEGEETIKELLAALVENRDPDTINGLVYLKDGEPFYTPKREPITDFDKFPLPDFSLVRYSDIKIYPVERIRGCGMNCEFCTVKGRPRHASPERLFEQISLLVETYKAKNFFIVDDLFGQQRDETIRFCRMLENYQQRIGVNLRLTVQIRLDKGRDDELLSAMRDAGIRTLCIGYESPIEEELQAMNKNINSADMISLTEKFHDYGFLVHGMFIFCYPLKELDSFEMSANERANCYKAFIRQTKLDTVQILLPVPIPGTELRDRLKREGRIYPLEIIGWEYYDGSFPLFAPDEPLTAEQVQEAGRRIMSRFYRFGYVFLVPLHILSFARMIFFFHNLRRGWRKWKRPWRNYLIRLGGWVILKKWVSKFKRDAFSDKLQKAKEIQKSRH